MTNVLPVICCVDDCRKLIGCHINNLGIMYCHQCPNCIVCVDRLDSGVSYGLCQRHFQDAMDLVRRLDETILADTQRA